MMTVDVVVTYAYMFGMNIERSALRSAMVLAVLIAAQPARAICFVPMTRALVLRPAANELVFRGTVVQITRTAAAGLRARREGTDHIAIHQKGSTRATMSTSR